MPSTDGTDASKSGIDEVLRKVAARQELRDLFFRTFREYRVDVWSAIRTQPSPPKPRSIALAPIMQPAFVWTGQGPGTR